MTMKRIISLILLLALSLTCVLALASCGDKDGAVTGDASDQIEVINAMFEAMLPKQTITTTTQDMGGISLKSVATLTIGTVDGLPAATYVNEYQQLADLDGGNVANLVTTKTEKRWYVEGKGLIKNGRGDYIEDPDGELDFRPKEGDIKITLNPAKLKSATYDAETETLVAEITKENATDLLKRFLMEDQKITSGLTLSITTSGGRISAIKLEFSAPENDIYLDEESDDESNMVTVAETKITIEALYSYDLVELTLE